MTLTDIGLLLILSIPIGAIGLFFYDISNFRWYRKMRGGHWEAWTGSLRNTWWLHSPSGSCSRFSYYNGHTKKFCEDYK